MVSSRFEGYWFFGPPVLRLTYLSYYDLFLLVSASAGVLKATPERKPRVT